jgi:hypothetical protein
MKVESLDTGAYTVPTPEPESDGTLTWTETTVVTVEAHAGGTSGLGFTYATAACAPLIQDVFAAVVVGADPMDVPSRWLAMVRAARNLGRPGLVSMAIAAVDTALWDLKARLLEQPLARLLGAVREEVPVYGSGGFTSLSDDELVEQLTGWTQGDGIPRVKMKIGTDRGGRERRDLERVALARRGVGDEVELYVDANGGYGRKQAVRVGRALADLDVGCGRSVTSASWTWRPGSTAPTSPTSSAWWPPERSTASRPTCRAAPGSRNGCGSPRWPPPTTWSSRATARSPFMPIRPRPSRTCAIWSTSPTTPGSTGCCSTACWTPSKASYERTGPGPAWA